MTPVCFSIFIFEAIRLKSIAIKVAFTVILKPSLCCVDQPEDFDHFPRLSMLNVRRYTSSPCTDLPLPAWQLQDDSGFHLPSLWVTYPGRHREDTMRGNSL